MLNKRKLAAFCVALSFGSAAGLICTSLTGVLTAGFAASVAVVCALLCLFSKTKILPAAFTAGFFCALIYFFVFISPCGRYEGKEITFECYTVAVSENGVTVVPEKGFPAGTRLLLNVSKDETAYSLSDFGIYESYRVTAVMSAPRYNSLYADSVRLSGVITEIGAGDYFAPVILRAVSEVREKCCALFDRSINAPEEAALAKAMTLGRRESISEETGSAFRDSGLYHLLALSGIHFSVVTGLVWLVLRALRLNTRLASAVTVVFIIAYLILVGDTPSVLRAAVAALVVCVAMFVRRTPDSVTSLSVAMALLLAANPYTLYSLSFSLSFLGTLGVLYSGTRTIALESSHKAASGGGRFFIAVSKTVAVTFYATAFTLPVSVINFESASLLTPLSNIVATIPCTLALESNMLLLVLGSLIPPLAAPLGALSRLCNRVLLGSVTFLSDTGALTLQASGTLCIVAAALLAASEVYLVLAHSEKHMKMSRAVFLVCLAFLVVCVALGALQA